MSIRCKLIYSFMIVLITCFMAGIVSANEAEPQAVKGTTQGTVTGSIMVRDEVPLERGEILFYDVSAGPPPNPAKYERTPDISGRMDAEGKFKIDLPEGRYYIGAIKRLSGERLGPPQEGDYLFVSLNEKGKAKEYHIQAQKTLDTGALSGAAPLSKEVLGERVITTAIEGSVYDTKWKPVEDAVVVAFVEPTLGRKPLFVSGRTDKDGKYILPVTEGTYYLRVRNSFASGPPEAGEIVGVYGNTQPKPVPVAECKIIKGIDFMVTLFPGRGRGPFLGPAANDD